MLEINKNKDTALPRVRVTADERKQIENRMLELGLKSIADYVRYCINKDLVQK